MFTEATFFLFYSQFCWCWAEIFLVSRSQSRLLWSFTAAYIGFNVVTEIVTVDARPHERWIIYALTESDIKNCGTVLMIIVNCFLCRSPQSTTGRVCCQTAEGPCDAQQETRRFDPSSSSRRIRRIWEGPGVSGLALRVHYGYVDICHWLIPLLW